jgi:hypothetical protein
MRLLLSLALGVVLAAAPRAASVSAPQEPVHCATCTGASPCKACTNCKACKHCKEKGGTCGTCKKK